MMETSGCGRRQGGAGAEEAEEAAPGAGSERTSSRHGVAGAGSERLCCASMLSLGNAEQRQRSEGEEQPEGVSGVWAARCPCQMPELWSAVLPGRLLGAMLGV